MGATKLSVLWQQRGGRTINTAVDSLDPQQLAQQSHLGETTWVGPYRRWRFLLACELLAMRRWGELVQHDGERLCWRIKRNGVQRRNASVYARQSLRSRRLDPLRVATDKGKCFIFSINYD